MPQSQPKPVIFGMSDVVLSDAEKVFFAEHNPLGFILFTRNCRDKEQVKALVNSLKELTEREDTLILIDQEGGRVQRLQPPVWCEYPPAQKFADMCHTDNTAEDMEQAKQAVYSNYKALAKELAEVGINTDCAPVLDLRLPDCHDIIGDRAFGDNPYQVAELARESCRGLQDAGVAPIIKHIPGHGRAKVDSHESLPVVDTPHETLSETDFLPFKQLADMPFAMTAHIKYTDIDDELPATLSPKVIDIIRNEIGFRGKLLTDDLSMKALTGSFTERTKQSLTAGCDIILHCNGDMKEMQEIAGAIPI